MDIRRGPDGKFVRYGESLEAWLGTLMDDGRRSADDVLEALRGELGVSAACSLGAGADVLADVARNDKTWAPNYHVKQYNVLIRQREILGECIKKLQEVARA